MGSFSARVKASGAIQVVREVQSTCPFNPPSCPLHLLEDNCCEKYLCEQLLHSGKQTELTHSVLQTHEIAMNSELDRINGMENRNTVVHFNSASSGKGY